VSSPQSLGEVPGGDSAAASGTASGSGRLRPKWPSWWPAAAKPSLDLIRIVAVWAIWLAVICSFQIIVQARLSPQRPDNTLSWTQYTTGQQMLPGRPLLDDPNMNEHVKYDSEYYLSIATGGYNDPNAQAYNFSGQHWSGIPILTPQQTEWTSLNYAFLPGYPFAMKPVIAVLTVVPFASDLTEYGRATLAGIIISALGGLLAMLALSRLMAYLGRRRRSTSGDDADTTGSWGGPAGLRAALYLLVFPTGFYLAQVYAEGLFIGLAFMACALAVEKKVVLASVFAVGAALVRPAGVFLVLPLAWSVFQSLRETGFRPKDWRIVASGVAALAPVVAFLLWFTSILGTTFMTVDKEFFNRTFDIQGSWNTWVAAFESMIQGVDKTGTGAYGGGPLPPESSVYLFFEFFAMAVALLGTIWLIRKMPGVAIFGLAVLVFSFGASAGSPNGMDRYVLGVPAIFLMVAWFGRHPVFDRTWVLASTLVMGMMVMLFTFGFWVA
jgi:hypothetical protein